MKRELTIVANDGDTVTFEGTLEQWEDCFFAFPFGSFNGQKFSHIMGFCENHGWDLTIRYTKTLDKLTSTK